MIHARHLVRAARPLWAAALVATTQLGCGGIFASSDVDPLRYFAPSAPERDRAASARPEGAAAPMKLRIGRVSSGEHLRQRIVFRSSPVEIGEYDELRWTEKPEEFVRRALLQSLFEGRGLTQAVGGAVPTVDVEVLAFEEVRKGDERAARVSVSYAVRDDRVVIAANTVTVERAAKTNEMERIVEAMSVALDEVSSTVGGEIEKALVAQATKEAAAAAEARDAAEREEAERREAERKRQEEDALPARKRPRLR